MAANPKLRFVVLAVALLGTAGAVYWASQLPQGDAAAGAPAPAVERPRPARPLTAAAGSSAEVGPPGDLDLNRLKRTPGSEASTDVFNRKSFAPAPPPRPAKPIAQPGAAVAAAPPPPPPPPPVPFSYMGRLAEGGKNLVFLAMGDRNLVVKAGDIIDNTYRVDEIGASALVLTYLPQNVRQSMPIGASQ